MTLVSLFMVAVVLGTQQREDELTEQREMITLELALLSEQELFAKMIGLLEELRRDSPELDDRIDKEAEIMARPADPQTVFSAMGPGGTSARQRRRATPTGVDAAHRKTSRPPASAAAIRLTTSTTSTRGP